MRIAIPLSGGKLSAHFGHCEQFGIFDTDSDTITSQQYLEPPAHEPGVLPKWLTGIQVQLVIAGGMGQRAQQLFKQSGIDVLVGATSSDPKEIIEQYLRQELVTGPNVCDH